MEEMRIVMENLSSFEIAIVVNIGLHLLGVSWHLEYDPEHRFEGCEE